MATLGLNPAECPSEVRPQDDGMKYHDSPHQGMEFDSRDRPWAAQQSGGYWQEQWRPDGGEYGFAGQGGNMDWTSGWQMPMAVNDGWQNRNRNSATKSKRRFCTSFPDVSQCRRGAGCAFAHSREEIAVPLLSIAEENQEQHALTDDFFMYKYKMSWCPVGVQHEWHTCVYAHNYQDARRPVTIGYGARLCPYWSKKDTGAEYSQRCPLGLRCPYSHGAKEQLYHPHYFKTVVCRDLRGKACPRHKLCAFYHHRHERRPTPPDDVEYTKPLSSEALPENWVADFLSPPFHAESGKPRMDDGKDRNMMQAPGQMEQSGQFGQMQCGMPFFPMLPGQMRSGENAELDNSPSHATHSHGMSSDSMVPWAFMASDGTSRLSN